MTIKRSTGRVSREARLDRIDLVFYWPEGSRAAALSKGQSLVVGREPPAEVRLDAGGLSRRHARFEWSDEGVLVEDLGSTNGTQLNGRTVQRAALTPGDTLTLGEVTVGVQGRRVGDALPVPLDGYERFVARLEDEVVRARTFSRPCGLLRLRPLKTVHVSQFATAVRGELRPVDFLGWFGSDELLVLLPEADEAATQQAGKRLLARAPVPLGVATAVFPGDGADAQALLAVLAEGARQLKPGHTLRHATLKPEAAAGVVLHSAALQQVFALGRKVAATTLPVLIQGETGAGKELLARAVHDASPRAKKPFVAINCAAIAPTLLESALFGHEKGAFTGADKRARGLFEQADGGTVFLDEVGELSLSAQAALLRVLETRRFFRVGGDQDVAVDVRLLAATHRDLEAAAKAGTFRADLRFRLEGVTLRLPALRERPEDVGPLARHFLAQFAASMGREVTGFTPEAEAALKGYAWPGNVRELKNVIERCVVVTNGPLVAEADLPERVLERRAVMPSGEAAVELPEGSSFQEAVAAQQKDLEKRLILDALQKTGGNQTKAAKLLQLPLRTLVHKMKVLGVKKRFGD